MNFVRAVAYHFCLNLPEKFSQPGDHFLAHPCMYHHLLQMSPELMFLAGAVYVGLRFVLYTVQFANIMLEAPVEVISALG